MMLNTFRNAHGHGCRYGLSCHLFDQGLLSSRVYSMCVGPCGVTCELCNVCYPISELICLYLYFYVALIYIKCFYCLQKKIREESVLI
jgi:hypothetical protein